MKTSPNQTLRHTHAPGLLLLCACLAAFSTNAEDISVFKGATTSVAVPEGVLRVSIGNQSVIDARPSADGASVTIIGLSAGTSDLRIQRLHGEELVDRVTVRSDLQETVGEIKQLLQDGGVDGVEVKPIGDHITLEGTVSTTKAYDRVAKISQSYGSVIMNLTRFDRPPEMNRLVEQAILKDIGGGDKIKARIEGDTVILEGQVYSEAEAKRAEDLAKLKMPKVMNLLTVEEVMIETDVQFVSVDLSAGSDIGQNILPSLATAGTATGGTGIKPALTFSASATAGINAVLNRGNSRTLINQNLSSKSGSSSSFRSGGTLEVQIAGNVGGSLAQIPYGLTISVKPTLRGGGKILNEIAVKVSSPTGSGTTINLAELLDLTDTVMCQEGETIVMAGLLQQINADTKTKTPVLGDIPVLNMFFSEKTKNKSSHELLVLLTPRRAESKAATGHAFSEDRLQLLQTAGDKK